MINTVICHIEGGLGKNILFTAVLKAIKKKYSKAQIIIVTSYPDVFIANPNVNKVLSADKITGIYSKYIMDKAVKVFITDPYQTSDFITQKKHLIEIWCDLCEVEYNNEQPELFLLKAEKEYFEKYYRRDKKILIMQPHGGAANQPQQYSWTRDIPETIVLEIIEKFKNEYDILHVKRHDQLVYANTLQATDNYRSIAIALTMSSKRLLIDSSTMHMAAALNLPSVVCWSTTNPKVFGYEMHTNILANKPTRPINLEHSYYQKHLLFEEVSQMPYNSFSEVFDVNSIIKALKL